ncbi:hypothetical protein IW967_00605 [Alicyclobacillus mali]|uniref:Uncharacterized protein n=1 Tax=Alicyclobacillus mali (ex Roth et al. 2021) TaxID=1123961 RepID=A0ABS0EZB8_9BACL|nr:hypothetical protein [Alicyclobacillus mali (ex Roth et al. 2021)]MBF8376390.1 hypothetical protein [Alicyclobacillus mali (ex Roth et al. 2021)]MCL6488904.1 hypothetical protein [Alicyclobacillus mali (ex Roth et al. 2021)]
MAIRRMRRMLDAFLVPVALGTVSTLVLAQLAMQVPRVRDHVEAMVQTHTVISVQTGTPPGVAEATGSIVLMADSAARAANVIVFRNGVSLGPFTTDEMQILVHSGDVISFRDTTPAGPPVTIYVQDGDSDMLYPVTGETITLGNGAGTASLEPVGFF